VLLEVFPNMPAKHGTFFPGYKYLKQVGINSLTDLDESQYVDVKPFFTKYDGSKFRTYTFARSFITNAKGKTATEIIAKFPAEKAAAYLPFLDQDMFDLAAVNDFLVKNFDRIFDKNNTYSTYYKKLAVLYDRVRHGFHAA